MQSLIAEASRLQQEYPGGNAEHLQQQQAQLTDAYGEVKERALARRVKLEAALELQKFLAQVNVKVPITRQR